MNPAPKSTKKSESEEEKEDEDKDEDEELKVEIMKSSPFKANESDNVLSTPE